MPNLVILFTFLSSVYCMGQNVFLNEFRVNDAGTDDAEFIELIGPAGADISGWTVAHINGSGASEIFSFTFPANAVFPDDGVIDNGGNPVGFIVLKNATHVVANADYDWGTQTLQNGPDGILLSDNLGNRIQALSYNGSGDLVGGSPPWRTVGADANDDRSLSAPDDVTESAMLPWSLAEATPGGLNANQSMGDISLPVQLSSFNATGGDSKVLLRWQTEAEVNNLGFIVERSTDDTTFTELASYISDERLKGQGNSSTTTRYTFTDVTVFNGHKYYYRLSDVDVNGNITQHNKIMVIPKASNVELRDVNEGGLPLYYKLEQNFPNPFNPDTQIRFNIPQPDDILLAVHNIVGKKVRVLYHGFLTAGFYELSWNGTNHAGKPVAAGIYFYTLCSDNYYASRKMVYLK